MKLSEERQKKVEENLGLVHKVINDKVHGPYQLGIYSREDLFQITRPVAKRTKLPMM